MITKGPFINVGTSDNFIHSLCQYNNFGINLIYRFLLKKYIAKNWNVNGKFISIELK